MLVVCVFTLHAHTKYLEKMDFECAKVEKSGVVLRLISLISRSCKPDEGGHSHISTRTPPFDPTCWEICGGTPRGLPRWCWVCLVLDSRGGYPWGGTVMLRDILLAKILSF